MTAATIASLVFFAFSLAAALAVEFLLTSFAKSVGLDRLVFVMAPALLAMLYSLIVYQNAERKIRRVGESVSRGILVMLMTWVSLSALITWAWYKPGEFGSSLGTTLLASGVAGGGPMLLDALGAGILTGVLILRKPPPRIGYCLTGIMYLRPPPSRRGASPVRVWFSKGVPYRRGARRSAVRGRAVAAVVL